MCRRNSRTTVEPPGRSKMHAHGSASVTSSSTGMMVQTMLVDGACSVVASLSVAARARDTCSLS
ncbi:hypothetical protein PABG_11119 [Paracoccidioides brasiliensis Pb03]|nr:hypothetical protein PABG_11119 [Paracoccidioides brasiliensis Pb03]